jgi:hypothetical protein
MRDIRVSRGAVEGFSVPGATAARASDVLCVSAFETKKKPSHRVAQWKGFSVSKIAAYYCGFSVPGATAARASDLLCVFALEIN